MTSPGFLAVRLGAATRLARRVRRRLRRSGTPRVIVTASSSNHADCLLNLLRSLELSRVSAEVIVYDLGMTQEQHDRVAAVAGISLRMFAFEAHPPHVDIAVEAGAYAWKPIIISDVARERPGLVLWLDAGDFVFDDLEWTWDTIASEGIYSPTTAGTVRRWTHPTTLTALGADDDILDYRNRCGALVGVDSRQPGVQRLLDRWRSAAMDAGIIAPPGSDRLNHRQDQAVLTVLYYQEQRGLGFRSVDQRGAVMLHFDELPAAAVPAAVQALRRHPELRRVRWKGHGS